MTDKKTPVTRDSVDKALDIAFGNKGASPTETKGVPGTPVYNGYIVDGEKDARVTGAQKYITY